MIEEKEKLAIRESLFHDAPFLGFVILYAIGFLACSTFLDLLEFFDPDIRHKSPMFYGVAWRYVFPLCQVFPWWHICRSAAKKKQGSSGVPD